MGVRNNKEKIIWFGENWLDNVYDFKIKEEQFLDGKIYYTIMMECSQRTPIFNQYAITLLLNISLKKYVLMATSYGADYIRANNLNYDSHPYFSQKSQCQKFIEEYIKNILMIPLQVMQTLMK